MRGHLFSLTEAATDCGSMVEGEHRALVDALMALDVLKYMQNHK
jgi:DNA polymerase III epsilon subunit-like protein